MNVIVPRVHWSSAITVDYTKGIIYYDWKYQIPQRVQVHKVNVISKYNHPQNV